MTFKCTSEEARTAAIRRQLLRAALPYCFYTRLLNRPIFEFASADDMMRAVMAAEGQLMMLATAVPPRGAGKLTLGAGKTARMAFPLRNGLEPGVASDLSRPADLAPATSHKQAKVL